MLLLDNDEKKRLQALAFMRSLKGHKIPPVCILTVLGWVSIFINTRPENWLDEADARSQIWEGHSLMFSWITLPRAQVDIHSIEQMSCKCDYNAGGIDLLTMVHDSNATAHANGIHLWNSLRHGPGEPVVITIL